MSEGEQPTVYHPEPQSNVGKWILIALAIVYVGASAFFIYDQHAKLDKVTQAQAVSDKQIGDLTKRMQSAEADGYRDLRPPALRERFPGSSGGPAWQPSSLSRAAEPPGWSRP